MAGTYSKNFDEELGLDMDSLVEAYLIDDLTHNYGEETIKEFCGEGGAADALLEVGVLKSKRSMMRLSKTSDLKRREIIAAIQMAKAAGDPNYKKLVKYKVLYKQARAKVVARFGAKARKAAIKGQKEYMKAMKGVNLTNTGAGAYLTDDPNR